MWFNKKKQTKAYIKNATIELVAQKKAHADVVKKTQQANQQLNELLEENGFTLKIYLAAGGRHPNTQKGT